MDSLQQKQPFTFEITALALGVASVMMCNCLFLSIPLGAVAVILALLSRGNRMELSTPAKVAITLGIIGMIVTVLVYVANLMYILQEFGSMENYLRYFCETMGYDFEEIFGDLFRE